MKCPYCSSQKMDLLLPKSGSKYALFEVDTHTGKRLSDALTVDVYGCPDCNGILLKSDFQFED